MIYVKGARIAADAIGMVASLSNFATLVWDSDTKENFNKLEKLEETINNLIKRLESEKSKIENKIRMHKGLRGKMEIIISHLEDHLDMQKLANSNKMNLNTQTMRGNYSNPETISTRNLLSISTEAVLKGFPSQLKRGFFYFEKATNGHYDVKDVTLWKGFKCGWSIGMALYNIYDSYDTISKAKNKKEESERLLTEAIKRKEELEEAVNMLKKVSDSLTDNLKKLANNFYEIYEKNAKTITDLLPLENEFRAVKEEVLEIVHAGEELRISNSVYSKIYHIINSVIDMVKASYQQWDQALMESSIKKIISYLEDLIDDSEELIHEVYDKSKESYSTLTFEVVERVYLEYKRSKELKEIIASMMRNTHNKSESDEELINRIYQGSRRDYPLITLSLIRETLEEIKQANCIRDAQ